MANHMVQIKGPTHGALDSPPARRHSSCPLPSGPSFQHPLHLLPPVLGGGPAPSTTAPRSSLLGVLAYLFVPITCSWLASPVMCNSWLDCTGALLSSSLLPCYPKSPPPRDRPTCSSAHRWCGARASPLHRPCIALGTRILACFLPLSAHRSATPLLRFFLSPIHVLAHSHPSTSLPLGCPLSPMLPLPSSCPHLHPYPPPLSPAAPTVGPAHGARHVLDVGRGPTTTSAGLPRPPVCAHSSGGRRRGGSTRYCHTEVDIGWLHKTNARSTAHATK